MAWYTPRRGGIAERIDAMLLSEGADGPGRELLTKGGTRSPEGIWCDADVYRIGEKVGGFELIEKSGVYYTRDAWSLWTDSLGRLRNDREAVAVWRGWLRSHGVGV